MDTFWIKISKAYVCLESRGRGNSNLERPGLRAMAVLINAEL